ncbi:hypothetical protein [Nereida sp. MMG025]|uniref:hypothetical protein n=1 Tax=Nereida sp. MMG025 TaxID=2909981 RepID=UPI001F3D7301|nr:hypothetical protein [Nereida sp. MMG025]MCF6444150.1 hypothetical protein [Nereida sp. MMG025]
MQKLYPLMFALTAAAITAGVVLFGAPERTQTQTVQVIATPEPVVVAPDLTEQTAPVVAPDVPAASEPEPIKMVTIKEPVCAIENGRKRCRFVSKEVPADTQ